MATSTQQILTLARKFPLLRAKLDRSNLTRQIREVRLYGVKVSLRADKLRIKDPSGSVFVESIPVSHHPDLKPVVLFVSHALRKYAYNILAQGCPIVVTGLGEATWAVGDITLRAEAYFDSCFRVKLFVIGPNGTKMDREILETRWPSPQELSALRDGLIADHALLSKLLVYLQKHENKFKCTHGFHIGGAIDVTFVNGKMTVSCFRETDFNNLRMALDVLDGFPAWSKKLEEEPSFEEPLESRGLDLV